MIYYLGADEGRRKKYAYGVDVADKTYERIICAKCNIDFIRNISLTIGLNEPIVLTNDYYPDFMWYSTFLVSEKTKEVFELEKITGYELEEANIISANELTLEEKRELKEDAVNVKKVAVNPPKYYKLHVSIGATYHEKSGVIFRGKCDECGYEDYTVVNPDNYNIPYHIVKKESLNGNDLFRSIGFGRAVFCTERFKEICEKHKLTGFLFKDAEAL